MNVRRILVGGVVASLVFAMFEMVVEGVIAGGAGFFGPPIAIGATIVRDIQGAANPLPFDVAALVLGLAGHMMNSVVLAAIFGYFISRRTRSEGAIIGLGAAWGVIVFAAMWLVVVPLVDPVMLNLNALAFLAGHVMWGATLGLLWARYGGGEPVPVQSPA